MYNTEYRQSDCIGQIIQLVKQSHQQSPEKKLV